jgi:hypothetical protein
MKKMVLALVVSLVLVFAVSYVSLADMTVKAAYDLGGTVSLLGASGSTDGGFSLGFEYTSEMDDNLMVGGGLEYQLPRKSNVINIGAIPLYGLVQYKFDQFYAIGRLGYNLFTYDPAPSSGSVGGGIYYGVGAGYSINEKMVLEAVYGISTMSFSESGITITGTYSKLGLSFGYKF